MTKNTQVIYLKDYQVPVFIIETTNLDIRIGDEYTSVVARLKVRRNLASDADTSALVLQGGSDIKLQEVMMDGLILDHSDYDLEDGMLSIHQCPEAFELTTECLIQPQLNTT